MRRFLVFLPLFVAILMACAPATTGRRVFELRVVNLCGGDNYTVRVYANQQYLGRVTTVESFYLPAGQYELRAEGTGLNGGMATRSVYMDADKLWTLCR
ncbi:hypothetical protein DV704_07455 [Meiothermus sp. QL-1]|nr:hypothetical protein DV704_07455 [Meiothermus sp. QL-1]